MLLWNYIYINPKKGILNRARARTRPRPRVWKRLKSFEDEHEDEDEDETANEFIGNCVNLAQFFSDQTGLLRPPLLWNFWEMDSILFF